MRLLGDEIMNTFVKTLTLAAGIGSIVSALMVTTDLFAQTDLEKVVQERQKLMKTMGRSFPPMVAVLKGESTDFVAAAAAAESMHDAMTKAIDMFPAGSANGEVAGSRAKPEVWTNAAEFKAASDDLIDTTAKLVEVAKSDDLNAFKEQFQLVGRACGGCHKGKGDAGGKFRVPKEGG